MKTQSHYYRVSAKVVPAWTVGVLALLLAVGIGGAMPIVERIAMFLP